MQPEWRRCAGRTWAPGPVPQAASGQPRARPGPAGVGPGPGPAVAEHAFTVTVRTGDHPDRGLAGGTGSLSHGPVAIIARDRAAGARVGWDVTPLRQLSI